jgi:hypothetical protein
MRGIRHRSCSERSTSTLRRAARLDSGLRTSAWFVLGKGSCGKGHGLSARRARQPDAVLVDPSVTLATAAVFQVEGVEGFEDKRVRRLYQKLGGINGRAPCWYQVRPPNGQIHLPVFTPSTTSSTKSVLRPPSLPVMYRSKHIGHRPGASRCTWEWIFPGSM